MATIGTLICNLIARTESFESGMKKSQNSLYNLTHSIASTQRSLLNLARIGFGGILMTQISRVANEVTAAHKAFAESEKGWRDYMNVIAESIPFFGRASRALREMIEEIRGTRKLKEMTKSFDDLINKVSDLHEALSYKLKGIGLLPIEQTELNVLREYEQTLKKINILEDEANRIKKQNPAFIMPNFEGMKTSALQIYSDTLKEIARAQKSIEWQKQLSFWNDLQERINDANMELRGFSDIHQEITRQIEEARKLFKGENLTVVNQLLELEKTLNQIEKNKAFKKLTEEISDFADTVMEKLGVFNYQAYFDYLAKLQKAVMAGFISEAQAKRAAELYQTEKGFEGGGYLQTAMREPLPTSSFLQSSRQVPILEGIEKNTAATATATQETQSLLSSIFMLPEREWY